MFGERDEAVFKFVRMWYAEMPLKAVEAHMATAESVLQHWVRGDRGVKLTQVDTMSKALKCSDQVILGYIPCTAKCRHCRLGQP